MKEQPASDRNEAKKEYLGIIFQCCRVYRRISKNRAGDAYVGYCPRCGKKVVIPIHPLGTNCRFFEVY